MSQKAIRREEKRLEKEVNKIIKNQFENIYQKFSEFEGQKLLKSGENKGYILNEVIRFDYKAILLNFQGDDYVNEVLDKHTDPRITFYDNGFKIVKKQGNNILEDKYEIQT
ncbi:MAG: hypothetical protein ACMXX6_00830 [Candidatus Woesearchaeota archaeon]